jgi:uncharacterized membrane-anchored protein YjiN (DUF445 family)
MRTIIVTEIGADLQYTRLNRAIAGGLVGLTLRAWRL